MGFLDRLFGRRDEPERRAPEDQAGRFDSSQPLTDEQAIERYRYMLRTASPDTIELAHAEAFAQLSPEQRARVLQELSATATPQERADLRPGEADPQALARMATRAELRRPGTLERTFGGMGWAGGGAGMMGGMAGSFLPALAGSLVGTMIAQQFFGGLDPAMGWAGADAGGLEQEVGADPAYDDAAYDSGGDIGGDDTGGDIGDMGGDFGGEF
jgi:hypothetical protein